MGRYDIAVIGGGPAGYISAVRGAQLGAEVVLFEKDVLGGTCLNRGCIPTKTYLKGAEIIHHIQMASMYGIDVNENFSVDMKKAVKNKNSVVNQLTQGVGALLKSNQVHVIDGEAYLESEHEIICDGKKYMADSIILCGGSKVDRVPIPGIEGKSVLTSDQILDIYERPKRLAIIGGGVVGCEIASVFKYYGSEVTIIEAESRILPRMDEDISRALTSAFKTEKIDVRTGCLVKEILEKGNISIIRCADGREITADKILLSVGRISDLSCLGKMKNRIQMEKGKIVVDDFMRTNIPNIYAAGDINGRNMLAHAAFKMGETAAENAMKKIKKCKLRHIPSCIYTIPECSGVGVTEKEAEEMYGDDGILIGKFPFSANGRALASGAKQGFVKIIAEKRYRELLGVHIFGGNATEMISEAASLMAAEIPVDEIADIVHAHPTFSEAFMEACGDAVGTCLHLPKRHK